MLDNSKSVARSLTMLTFEEVRVKVKKIMSTSIPGRVYNDALLLISVGSSIEFMYQTYLDPANPENSDLLVKLNIVEKCLAGLFMADWCLNFFMADHKIKFMTR